MDPVIYVFVSYMIFILVPLIPAIIIYKLFPDTQVGAKGLLGNLKINATGAFAAYLITSTLGGYYFAGFVKEKIDDMDNKYQTYEVNASIEFVNVDGVPFPDQANLVKMLDIQVKPHYIIDKNKDFIKFKATGTNKTFSVCFKTNSSEDFEPENRDLSKYVSSATERTIDLGKIVLKATGQKYIYNTNTPAEGAKASNVIIDTLPPAN